MFFMLYVVVNVGQVSEIINHQGFY